MCEKFENPWFFCLLLEGYFRLSRQRKSGPSCEIMRGVIIDNTCKFWQFHNQTKSTRELQNTVVLNLRKEKDNTH